MEMETKLEGKKAISMLNGRQVEGRVLAVNEPGPGSRRRCGGGRGRRRLRRRWRWRLAVVAAAAVAAVGNRRHCSVERRNEARHHVGRVAVSLAGFSV